MNDIKLNTDRLMSHIHDEFNKPFETEGIQRISNGVTEYQEENSQRKIENSEYFKNIEKNTAYIKDLVSLIQNSNEQQQEVIGIISEMLQIAAAKDPEEAKSIFRKVMDSAETIIKDAETMGKLYTIGMLICQGVK